MSCSQSSPPDRCPKRPTSSASWSIWKFRLTSNAGQSAWLTICMSIRSRRLEGTLEDKGYHLDNTLMSKMMRALIYYVEETQLHNLDAPHRLLKKSQHEAYTHAWERHPHGDHDDTPPEWREYK